MDVLNKNVRLKNCIPFNKADYSLISKTTDLANKKQIEMIRAAMWSCFYGDMSLYLADGVGVLHVWMHICIINRCLPKKRGGRPGSESWLQILSQTWQNFYRRFLLSIWKMEQRCDPLSAVSNTAAQHRLPFLRLHCLIMFKANKQNYQKVAVSSRPPVI